MNLISSLMETARRSGDKAAFIYEDQVTTYAEWNEEVSRFASGLSKLGLKRGDHVALVAGNSPVFLTSLYGAIRAGAAVIPINPDYTADEIEYILHNGDVRIVVTVGALCEKVCTAAARVPSIQNLIVAHPDAADSSLEEAKTVCLFNVATFQGVVENGDAANQFEMPDDDDTAVILYTSGTTGRPKGAMLTHKNLYSNASDTGVNLEYSEHDKVFATLPAFHVFCLTVAINASVVRGATILLMPRFSPKEVFRLANSYGATVFVGVPTMYNFLLQYPDAVPEDFKSIRLCVSGGASMPVAVLEKFEEKFEVVVSEGYGLSEASPVTCFNDIHRGRKAGSIGTSVVNVENRVVDEQGLPVPVGEVGELVVRGPNVMKGYYKMPEKTAETIRDGWLYTGDMARQDEDGYFYIVDRKKDMIIVGGYNVYPREVEETLYRHPGVAEAAVVGAPDSNFGESVRAFAVRKDETLTEEELLVYCSHHLAKYKVPKSITFVVELPKNATGKIMRRDLKDAFVTN